MTQPDDPPCHRDDCPATNHCRTCGVHHCVDSLARMHDPKGERQ